jgi:hypothetical protein
LAVLITLSLYKNEPQSISFRSLPKDGGSIVIKTRPSRGFRWCTTVLQGCLIGGSTIVGQSATAEVSIFLQTYFNEYFRNCSTCQNCLLPSR